MQKRLVLFFILTALILFASQKLLVPPRRQPPEPVPSSREEPLEVAADETPAREPRELPMPAIADTAVIPEPVTVETGDVRIVFSSLGAGIVEAELKNFESPDGGPVRLLDGGLAPITLLKVGGDTLSLENTPFSWHKRSSTHTGMLETVVEFACSLAHRGRLVKTYRFPASGYLFSVEHVLEGQTVDSSAVVWKAPLLPTERNKKDDLGYSSVTGKELNGIRKIKLSSLRKQPMKPLEGQDFAWLAARTKYFLAAIIPAESPMTRATVHRGPEGRGPTFTAWAPGGPRSFQIYLGPMSPSHLRDIGVGLEVVAEFGASPLRPISRLMLSYMTALHKQVPNYGVVVILLAITIKILFYPLTHKSFESMRRMQQLQPLINELKEKHKNNPQALQKATMELYKQHKVSPLGGCLPMLLQMPVFFALYPLLRGTIELRGAAFVGWIRDLSVPDPYYVLPVVMGVAMFLQQKMSTADKRQAAMMYIMPIFLTYIFLRLPAGLVLYWLVFNVLSIAQQALMKGKIQAPAQPAQRKGPSRRSRKGGSAKRR